MAALCWKIEGLNSSLIYCYTWLILLWLNCDFLNTLITPILAAEVYAPARIHNGLLLQYNCIFSSAFLSFLKVFHHTVGMDREEWK